MKRDRDPQRLEDVDAEFARLVSTLRASGPSKDALVRALGAVAAVPPAPSAPAPRRWLRLVPWAGVGVMVATLSAVGYVRSKGSSPGDEHAASVPGTPQVEAPAPVAHGEPNAAATSTIRVDDLPSAPATPSPPSVAGKPTVATKPVVAPPETTAPATTSVARADGIRDELALVERARAQLSRGDSAEALRTLETHRTQFPSGMFVPEVEVMRIEALAASGNAEAARAEGNRFLERRSTSPYAERVRSVLAKVR